MDWWRTENPPRATCTQRRLAQIHFVRYRDRTVGNMEMPVVCPDAAWSRVPALSAQRLDLGVCGAEIHKIALFHSLYGYGLRHKSSENSRIRLKSYLCALNAGTRDQAVSGQTAGISMYPTGLSLYLTKWICTSRLCADVVRGSV